MRRLLVLAAAAVAPVTLLAGCGSTTTYHLAATRACLAKAKGVKVSSRLGRDFIASSATAGAFVARFGRRNEVTISFGASKGDADQLVQGYEHLHGKNIGIADVLRPKANAVMLWVAHPTDADLGTVDGCLK